MKNTNLFAISLLVIILSLTLNFKRKEGFDDSNKVEKIYSCKIDSNKEGEKNTYVISGSAPENSNEINFNEIETDLKKLVQENKINIFDDIEIDISEKDKWTPKPLNIFTPVYKIKKLEFNTGNRVKGQILLLFIINLKQKLTQILEQILKYHIMVILNILMV